MWAKVVHHGKKWPRAENHLDCRRCPDCGATVHDNHGQFQHQQYHVELAEMLQTVLQCALTEALAEAGLIERGPEVSWSAHSEQVSPPWTAAVDGGGQEAIEG